MPALGGIRPYAQMDLQRAPRDGPLAWLLVGLWVGKGAFVPSNPPSAHFPCSLEGTQGTDPGQPPPDQLVTIHKGLKGAERGLRSVKCPGRWGAGCCMEDAQRAGFINSYAAPGAGDYSHLISCLVDLLKDILVD